MHPSAAQGLLVFSHGNSFPASTYRVMFAELERRGFTVKAVEKFGHDPRFPVTANWPHLVDELFEFAEAEAVKAGQPAWLVGHSLGGFLSTLCAARHPEIARGVLMLDAPLIGGWKAHVLHAAKRTALAGQVGPGAISRRRRDRWNSAEEVLAHLQRKKIFAHWDPRVLHDYVKHGTRSEGGQRVLAFSREVETAIYNTLPHHLARVLARHPLQCPAAFIGGLHSRERELVGMALTDKVTQGRITLLEGSHLFPMEKPEATAAAIEAALLGMASDRLPARR